MPFRHEAIHLPDRPLEVEIGIASESCFFADLTGRVNGVFASTFLVFDNDTPIEVIISFPDGAALRAWGTVRFIRTADDQQRPGLGIAFTKIEPRDYAVIVGFCEQYRAPMLHDE